MHRRDCDRYATRMFASTRSRERDFGERGHQVLTR
jgi:hypothetical protein